MNLNINYLKGEEWSFEGWEKTQPDNNASGDAVAYWWHPGYRIDATWKWDDVPNPAKHDFICKSYL